jgi:putative ABC transport system substrate-binding protein
LREAAKQVGVALIPALLETPYPDSEYRRVFAAMAQDRPAALIVTPAIANFAHQKLIIELAGSARLPAIYPSRSFVDQGGMMSYGASYPDLYRRMASDIAQILGGAKPGDIPYYQASRFELVINLKTAKALGLTLPPSLFARADEVIE